MKSLPSAPKSGTDTGRLSLHRIAAVGADVVREWLLAEALASDPLLKDALA